MHSGIISFLTLYIHHEQKGEFKWNAVVVFVLIVIHGAASFFTDPDSNLRILLSFTTTSLLCYLSAMLSTFWVIKWYLQQLREDSLNEDMFLKLEEILETKDGFYLFADHLAQEFSFEHLSFILEVLQIKHDVLANKYAIHIFSCALCTFFHVVITYRWINDEDIGVLLNLKKHIIERVRKKDLHIMTLVDFKNALKYIMEQYIDPKSDFGINVSGGMRTDINKKYEQTKLKGVKHKAKNDTHIIEELQRVATMDITTMTPSDDEMKEVNFQNMVGRDEFVKSAIVIFDDALTAVMKLLKLDSLKRFYDSRDYRTLIHNMDKAKKENRTLSV